MTSPTLTHDSSRDIVAGFLGDMIQRLDWHAAQAWWAEGDELVPGMWALADGAPQSFRDLVTSHEPLLIDDAGLRFLEPTVVAAAALPCVRACVPQLTEMGLDSLVVLDIPGVFDLDVRLVFVPSAAQPFTPRIAEMLASAARLMPTVIRGERERQELSASAGRDPLTGLLNRRGLEAAVESMPSVTDHRAVLFIDLDKFKTVNDTHGHPVGDDVLTTVARHLSSQIRPADCLARLGGDEFVIVACAVAGPDAARLLAGRILEAITTDLRSAAGSVVPITASVGVALWDGVQTFADALAAADLLMYEAKRGGGGVGSVDRDGRLVLTVDGSGRAQPDVSHDSPLDTETLTDLVTGATWGRIVRLPGALAPLATDVVAARIDEALDVGSTEEVILELAGTAWALEGRLAGVIAALRAQRPTASLNLMVGEGIGSDLLRQIVAEVTDQLSLGVVFVGAGPDAAAIATVGGPNPRAIVLAAAVVDALAEAEASDIPVRIVTAVADVLGIPVIARAIPSASVSARLVAAGCAVGGFTVSPEEPVKEIE